MKVHQILALVDVKYDSVFPTDSTLTRDKNLMSHFHEVAMQMQKHNGLNYVPREKSIDGRVFEHAADCKVLVDLLARMPGLKSSGHVQGYRPPQPDDVCFFIQVVDDMPQGGDKAAESESTELNSKYEQKIMQELGITKEKNICLKINRLFIDLAMQANGKADLYFHAYFWEVYLKQLDVKQAANALKGD